MHIEPGIVDGAKMALSYGTAAAAAGWSLKLVADDLSDHNPRSFVLRTIIAVVITLFCFEVLPHPPMGVSEVHMIVGTTMLLILGVGPAAVGMAAGMAIQGMIFAPSDLMMYTVNLSTLLFPLFAIHEIAKRTIPAKKAYVDLSYNEVLRLSVAFQGGIVLWVAFWVFYGQGFAVWSDVASFGAAYMLIVLIEPIIDLGALAVAKTLRRFEGSGLFVNRLHHPAA
ncbi:energy-coupling factor ABC transporter permease [Roseovarius sp. D22-M7]|uniref:energy-coupling factor ABC transporter permease n=1 Tax=Roseovarius sp. D22-M7 TaxID=3127116 RepID=UPI00300F917E